MIICYRQVIALVEADVSVIELIKVASGCVEHHGGGGSLVPVHYGGGILGEGYWTEHPLALNGIHANPVEVVGLDLHVRGSEQDDGFVV